ncbi:glycosyltransferase family 2 protein [Polyangium fumosum]|uniref:Glycosyltransferase n=1 Tax=Polyangium fumosum TaxID=889272 RepID=A0A4U1JG49_9BACT|nr:glycosyltransferase [Polyangium fumosum]TKD09171.1 glycosyltransferase [Polyangium fumosum]
MNAPASSAPLLTIGITCYAEGDWLLDCWNSVLAQTDPRWCAVLVMDGTEHARTREIFAALNHPRLVKYAMPTNMGPYPTRNKAFELTETPFHFYVDGDDQLVPSSVALVLDTFARHPDAAFVYGDNERFGAYTLVHKHRREVTWDDFITGQPTPGPCAYRKDLWVELGGYTDELARGNGDYDFLIGAAEAGRRGYHCGEILYRYRVGNAAKVSKSYDRRYHETHEIMVKRHPRFFADPARRDRFLALAYLRAAEANLAVDPRRARELARKAIDLGLRFDTRPWKTLAKAGLAELSRARSSRRGAAPPR